MTDTMTIKKGFSGTWPDILTPVKSNLSIDFQRLESHIRTLFFKGVNGVVLFSHAGEGASFSYAEKSETITGLIKAGISPDSIILSITSNSVPDSVHLIHLAESLGLHGVLLSPPFYYKPVSADGLIHYFEYLTAYIKSPDTKLYIHLLPSSTHLDIPEVALSTILDRWGNHIYGIVNQTDVSSISDDLRKSFVNKVMIYTANETDIKRLSSSGTISLMANLIPRVIKGLIMGQQAGGGSTFIPGMKDKTTVDTRASELQLLVAKHPFIASYKYLMSLLYRDAEWRRSRPPLSPLDNASYEILNKEFKKFNIQTNDE